MFDDEIISRVCYNFAGRYDADIKAQLRGYTKLSKPLNEAYNKYDSIGYREHTAAEEKQAEKEYERCKAEYEKEKKNWTGFMNWNGWQERKLSNILRTVAEIFIN